jgi:hypothetical protein
MDRQVEDARSRILEGGPRPVQNGIYGARTILPNSQVERRVSPITDKGIDGVPEEGWGSDEEENQTESEQDKQDELNMCGWMAQADKDKLEVPKGRQIEREPREINKFKMDSIEVQLPKGRVNRVIQKQCQHDSYNLETYKMVERSGWSWMDGNAVEKECGQCQKRKKLSGQNPMYYCRACHAHGICNGCWLSLILSDSSSGRGQRKKQCQDGHKVSAGSLFETEGLEEEDSMGCISISSGHMGE